MFTPCLVSVTPWLCSCASIAKGVGLHLLGESSTGLWSIKTLSPQSLVQENLQMLLHKAEARSSSFFPPIS